MSAAVTTLTPDQPSHSAWLVSLVLRLIDYGKELASSLRLHGIAALGERPFIFGTEDVALILERITRGLLRAAALQDKITRNAHSLDDAKPKLPRPPREPCTDRAATRPAATSDPRLAALPTEQQIADEVRRRPIGAVLADICRDLGILPCHPLWTELRRAINRYSGNYARLLTDLFDRMLPPAPPIVVPDALPPPAIGTGPP